MPTISIDTFFACSLMIIVVLSAMAGLSKVLSTYMNTTVGGENIDERYEEISKYILLSEGKPLNWGQNGQITPETFGLAEADSENPYTLDLDKVSRLNGDNIHAVSYGQIFTALKMSDVAFRLEIKPIFQVTINLTSTFEAVNETTYQFEISTEKNGVPVQTWLKYYVIAENYLETSTTYASAGRTSLNVTLSNTVKGPALLIVFARASVNAEMVSFNAQAFTHNSVEPESRGTFLRLSPLNYSLDVSFNYPNISLSNAYALTFNCSSNLTQTASSNESAAYKIPHFLDESPTLIVVTGWNSTNFFAEWTAYPQIPVEIGMDFSNALTISNVYNFDYLVTINSVIYKCTVWLGGPKK